MVVNCGQNAIGQYMCPQTVGSALGSCDVHTEWALEARRG